jgi:hypothetical protein
MTTAYARWEGTGWTKQEFWDKLNAPERFAVYVGNLNYQVENGGWSQWLGNQYATPETLGYLLRTVLQMTLGPDDQSTVSAKVHAMLQDFRKRVSDSDMAVGYMVSGDEEDNSDWLHDLDTRYYAVNADFMKECEAFLDAQWPPPVTEPVPSEPPQSAVDKLHAKWLVDGRLAGLDVSAMPETWLARLYGLLEEMG